MSRFGRRLLVLQAVTLPSVGVTAAEEDSWLYVLEGTLRQETDYTYVLCLTAEERSFEATIPLLGSVDQPWYRVSIAEQLVMSDIEWTSEREEADPWGWPNRWTILGWRTEAPEIRVERRVHAVSRADYGAILTRDPYPVDRTKLPFEAHDGLYPTLQIQSGTRRSSRLRRGSLSGA